MTRKLIYLKIAHDRHGIPSEQWISYRTFSDQLDQWKSQGELPQTLGQIKAKLFQWDYPPAGVFFGLTSREVKLELIRELRHLQPLLTSQTIPSSKVRLAIAQAYCLAMGEKLIAEAMTDPQVVEARARFLLPIITLIKTDPAWYVRAEVMEPAIRFKLFDGIKDFEKDILKAIVSESDSRAQLKMLQYLGTATFSKELMEQALTQMI